MLKYSDSDSQFSWAHLSLTSHTVILKLTENLYWTLQQSKPKYEVPWPSCVCAYDFGLTLTCTWREVKCSNQTYISTLNNLHHALHVIKLIIVKLIIIILIELTEIITSSIKIIIWTHVKESLPMIQMEFNFRKLINVWFAHDNN